MGKQTNKHQLTGQTDLRIESILFLMKLEMHACSFAWRITKLRSVRVLASKWKCIIENW